MTDWKKLYKQRNWTELENWWPHCDDQNEVAKFLQCLLTDVPRVVRHNGMEGQEDYGRPDEVPAEWKGAAKILALGELAAKVEGDPISIPARWEIDRTEIVRTLKRFAGAEEVTSGDVALSRAEHARIALDLLGSIDWCTAAMAKEIDPDGANLDDREWLIDFAKEIAFHAFHAGAHSRAAVGKEIEGHAVRGHKVFSAAQEAGRLRRTQTLPRTALVLNRMQELIDRGSTASNAARLTAAEGVGTSANANLTAYNREKRAKQK